MRALVTGCAGFIGGHLCERLIREGWRVTGVDSLEPTYDTIGRRSRVATLAATGNLEFIEGDLNRMDLRPLILEADVVFHLAARPGVRASWDDFSRVADANVIATQRVLDALVGTQQTRMVFASSSSVYGQALSYPTSENQKTAPISPYGVTKAACESLVSAYVSQFDLDVTSLRYFTVFGPHQRSDMAFTRWIKAAFQNQPLPVFGDGSAERDFTYVDDVVAATILAAETPAGGHAVFNVAGGNPASLQTVFNLIETFTSHPVGFEFLPVAKGDPPRTGGDTTKIRQALGWEPQWSLEDGIAAQVAWIRDVLNRV